MVDIDYLIVTYIVSLFVDWIFQTEWQAINKSKWNKNDNKKNIINSIVKSFYDICKYNFTNRIHNS